MFTPDEITIAKASTLPLASTKEEDSKDIRRCLSGPLIGQVESMWTKCGDSVSVEFGTASY